MNTGIIVEYNPFHNGHKLHIEKTRQACLSSSIIAIMSGNFVQRGEPSILDKYTRTKMALLNGVDMVIELPTVYSTGSADIFSYGAIDILNKTNMIDSLCFGSEIGKLDTLIDVAKLFANEPQEFKNILNLELSKGISYPKARLNSASKYFNKDLSFLSLPNNILALEYIKFLIATKSKIKPMTIEREKADFHSQTITSDIASATAIRKAITDNNLSSIYNAIPENCHCFYDNLNPPVINDLTLILRYILSIKTPEDISKISDITEGLENRILKTYDYKSITELIDKIKTKRYTYSKLQRAILHIILDIKKSDIPTENQYIRVLGFKKNSANLLSELTQKSSVPIITNMKNAEKQLSANAFSYLQKEITYNNIYHQLTDYKLFSDYTTPMIII